ncbi:MAG: serine/threonine protein kinase [Anaerolineales bacterium]|nr:serine/threonine protein kinase [Anaerolineales bacterium]
MTVCRGLSHAAQKQPGLVHRDLKPANILITQDRMAKITDFGLATVAQQANLELTDLPFSPGESQSLLHLGSFVGTPAYAAPEHWDTPEKVDGRADIYAVGCILYEILTGKRPFEVDFKPGNPSEKSAWLENWRLAHEQKSLSLPGDWPASLREIVQTCLQKESGRRFADVEELLEDISRVYEEQFGEVPKTIEIVQTLYLRMIITLGVLLMIELRSMREL